VNGDDLDEYESKLELSLYREYKDVVSMFSHVVETERRFYLANNVQLETKSADGRTWFELELKDAWVWDMYRPARFVSHVRVVTFKDVNVEQLSHPEKWDTPELDPAPEPPTS
jgi:Protein of unknown function (DUF2469)